MPPNPGRGYIATLIFSNLPKGAMSTLLTGSEDVLHGVVGAMRFVATAGATRPFEGQEAELVRAMALTFESGRSGLTVGGPVLEAHGTWASDDLALSELRRMLPDARARHEAMVAATLCVLMTDEFDPAGEEALAALADGLGVDGEAAAIIEQISNDSAAVAGSDLFRHFLAERSDVSLEVITERMARLEEPVTTSPEDFAAYVDLLNGCPAGSVGAELLRFYRHTGYDIPGTPGVPPLSVLGNHDLHHILAGYSTSDLDEVNVAMYVASNNADGGMYYLAVVLMQWHHNVQVSPFAPSHCVLDPTQLSEAAWRGAATGFDVSDLAWDWKSILPENLTEVRSTLEIPDGGTVPHGGSWDALGRGDA